MSSKRKPKLQAGEEVWVRGKVVQVGTLGDEVRVEFQGTHTALGWVDAECVLPATGPLTADQLHNAWPDSNDWNEYARNVNKLLGAPGPLTGELHELLISLPCRNWSTWERGTPNPLTKQAWKPCLSDNCIGCRIERILARQSQPAPTVSGKRQARELACQYIYGNKENLLCSNATCERAGNGFTGYLCGVCRLEDMIAGALEQPDSGKLREAARKLLSKLDQVEKDTQGIFVMAHVHGQDYKGANWSEEYKELEVALTGEAQPKWGAEIAARLETGEWDDRAATGKEKK
jgi:hypothetical protein